MAGYSRLFEGRSESLEEELAAWLCSRPLLNEQLCVHSRVAPRERKAKDQRMSKVDNNITLTLTWMRSVIYDVRRSENASCVILKRLVTSARDLLVH